MKHEKEWITCDRCGKELKNNIENFRWGSLVQTLTRRLNMDIQTVVTQSYISNVEVEKINKKLSVPEIAIMTYRSTKTKRMDLCADCRKAFEMFMGNEV